MSEVGRFWSTDTMVSSTADGFVYQYKGTERASRSGPKYHTGVGFYVFHKSAGLRTFTGAFTAWEEDRNRRVEGRQLNKTEAEDIKESVGRKSLFRRFLSEKKERAGAESFLPLDKLFTKRLLDVLTRNNLDQEINELKAVWGRNPLCMAFLLRTILEKVLTKAFLKQGLRDRIIKAEEEMVTLDKMINIAMQEKISGIPILTKQTGKAAHSIRFIGNTAAHNLWTGVDLDSIYTSFPQIKTAISELSRYL
jgi:hypothetical protein